jgi:hypothetical protein
MEQQPDNEFFVEPARAEQRAAPSRTPAIIGFLIGGAVVLALGFVGSMRRDAGGDSAPALRLLAPADGDTVDNPVVLRFTTPADLRLQRDGWIADDLHLHALADHRELMPGAAEITTDGESFSWTLQPLQPGEHRVYLTWAGRNHANIAGPTDTIRIIVRQATGDRR